MHCSPFCEKQAGKRTSVVKITKKQAKIQIVQN